MLYDVCVMTEMNLPSRRAILRSAALPFAFGFAMEAQEPHRDYEESKVRRYTLPDPLLLSDGERVSGASMWEQRRRGELLSLV